MGRTNQQRRAAKKRKKQQRGRRAPRGGGDDLPPVDELVRAAALAWGADDDSHDALVEVLAAHADTAVRAIDERLGDEVGGLWSRGWAPADVVRVAWRKLSVAHAALAAAVVIADGRGRAERGEPLHPRWEAQLAALAEQAAPGPKLNAEKVRLGVPLLALLSRLGSLPTTVPAPGQAAAAAVCARGLDERVLARVRGLLAKAEATEFEQEAEALTAKAQELIARHAVDEALLHAGADAGEPSARRIPVDEPYAEAKAAVVGEVAEANRCRAVYVKEAGWVTVVGYEGDLDAVELLAASLLAQATAAIVRHGSKRDAAGRSRTRSFRRSFLYGFAGRIGQRLRETAEAQTSAAAAVDGRLLPALRARDEKVDAAVAAAFPHVEHRSGAISHGGGFAAGQAAAELADLDVSAGALGDAPAS